MQALTREAGRHPVDARAFGSPATSNLVGHVGFEGWRKRGIPQEERPVSAFVSVFNR